MATSSDGLATVTSSAVTRPAAMAACALARLSNKPRSTSRRSMRWRGAIAAELSRFLVQGKPGLRSGRGRGGGVDPLRRLAGVAHAVAALALGLIERLVGALHQVVKALHPGVRFGHADADGDPHGNAIPLEWRRLQPLPHLVGVPHRFLPRGLRQQQDELLSAEAGQDVRASDVASADIGDMADDGVTCVMAEAVVDRLEQVDVEDHQRQRTLLARVLEALVLGQGEEMTA